MQPLSARRRLIYLLVLILVFVTALPVTILYATGYRYKPGTGLVRIGGIFISVPYSGAKVFLNGKVLGESGFLQHDFYVGTLVPDTYNVSVEEVGMLQWTRSLVVEEQLVTDARALLIKKDIGILRLVVATTTDATSSPLVATTTRVSPDDDAAIKAAFNKPAATSTVGTLGEFRGEAIFVEKGDTYVRWMNAGEFPPSVFCESPSSCVPRIQIEASPNTKSVNAAFFMGGIVYTTLERGVYFSEADVRPGIIRMPIYEKPGADFRIVLGRLFVKDGSKYYEIELQ